MYGAYVAGCAGLLRAGSGAVHSYPETRLLCWRHSRLLAPRGWGVRAPPQPTPENRYLLKNRDKTAGL